MTDVKPLTKREFDALKPAVVFGWSIERDGYQRLLWDGDYLMPFRATATLEKLVQKGLMELVCGREYRATFEAARYKCSCISGKTYASDDSDDSDEIIDCPKCGGTGMLDVPQEPTPPRRAVDSRSSKKGAPKATRMAGDGEVLS